MTAILLKEINLEEAVKFMCDGNVYFKSTTIKNLTESNLRESIMNGTGYYIEQSKESKKVYTIYDREYKGLLGEYSGYKDYHVGDIVTYKHFTDESFVQYGTVIKLNGKFSVRGWGDDSLEKLEREASVKPFKKYYDVTSDDISNYNLKIYIK